MAIEQIGIRITAEGVYEVSSGMKLTAEQVGKLGETLQQASRAGGAFADSQQKVREAATDAGAAVKGAGSEVDKAGEQSSGAAGKMSLLAKGIAGVGVAVGGLIAANVAKLFGEINRADEIQKLAERTKISAEQLSVLAYQARLADTDINTLTAGVRTFNRVLFDAQRNATNENAGLLKQLGISPADITNQTQAIDVLRDRLSRITDESTQLAVAQKLLGRNIGQDLLPFLTQSSAEFAKSADEGRRWALISGQSAQEAALLKDQLTTLNFASGELARAIQQPLVPWLNELIKAFLESRKAGDGLAMSLLAVGRAAVIDTPLAAITKQLAAAEAALAELEANRIRGQARSQARGDFRDPAAAEGGIVNRQIQAARERVEALRREETFLREARTGFADQVSRRAARDERPPIEIDPASLRDEKPKRDSVGERITELTAELRDKVARATNEINEAPETKAYFDLIRRITTGDLREASTPAKQAFAQVATEQFSAARNQRELEEYAAHHLRLQIMLNERQSKFDTAAEKEYAEEKKHQDEFMRLVDQGEQRIAEAKARNREALDKAGQQVTERTRSPFEGYEAQIERLNTLLDAGVISWETYGRAVEQAAQDMQRAQRQADALGRVIEHSTMQATARSSEMLLDWAEGQKIKMSDLVQTLLRDIQRVILTQMVLNPARQAASNLVQGLVTSLITSAATGGSSNSAAGAQGSFGPAESSGATTTYAHTGGVIGVDRLPKYHAGGVVQGLEGGEGPATARSAKPQRKIAANEQLAVLLKGEGVFTRQQMRALAPVSTSREALFTPAQRQALAPVAGGIPNVSQLGVKRDTTDGRNAGRQIAATEQLALLLKGEGVFTREQMRALAPVAGERAALFTPAQRLALAPGVAGRAAGDDARVIVLEDRRAARALPAYHTGGIVGVDRTGAGVADAPVALQGARGPAGQVGQAARASASTSNVFNISVTVDASGGKVQGPAEGQALGGRMVEAIRAVVVEETVKQKRPGGTLYGRQ
jgi:hypothetical protein